MTMTRKQKIAEFEQGYNVIVTGRHLHVTDAMKAYAEEKLSKIERFGNRIIDINVTMDIQKLEHRVDIVMKYGHTIIKSQGSSTDMYVSIDQAIDKLEAQLIKYKSRLQNHHAKGHPIVEIPEIIYRSGFEAEDEEEANQAIEAETRRRLEDGFRLHRIVSVESQPLKILTDEEAIMKMELSGAYVSVFRAEQTRKLKVIYRREDGNFGIIEPE